MKVKIRPRQTWRQGFAGPNKTERGRSNQTSPPRDEIKTEIKTNICRSRRDWDRNRDKDLKFERKPRLGQK